MALIYRRNPILRHTSGALYAPLLPLPYGVSAPGEWRHGPGPSDGEAECLTSQGPRSPQGTYPALTFQRMKVSWKLSRLTFRMAGMEASTEKKAPFGHLLYGSHSAY